MTVTGFLGKGPDPEVWRLYLSDELDEYLEFSAEDVLHTKPLPEERSPLGGTIVWLRADASVRHTVVESRQIQAEFFKGGITSGFMAAAGPTISTMAAARPATGYACTRNYICSTNPHIPACQIHTEVCGSAYCGPSTGAFCPTGAFIENC